MKRGQSALEYLVTYGWAILAIVIVAAVLWYFGIFNPSKWSASKQCGGFASFTCEDYSANATSTTIVLGNNVGRSITISNATCSPASVGPTGRTTCTASVGGNVGDQVNIQIDYVDSKSGLSHSETGFLKVT
ncbi:MAG: hypothetical protein QW343_01525 [Candidatus Norongarragalinales archaeon]